MSAGEMLKFTKLPNPAIDRARKWADSAIKKGLLSEVTTPSGSQKELRVIDRASSVFKERKQFLSAILQLDKAYAEDDAEKIVDDIIFEVEFYSKSYYPAIDGDMAESATSTALVQFNVIWDSATLSILGRIIGPILRAEPCLLIGDIKITPSTLFAAAIVEILRDVGMRIKFIAEKSKTVPVDKWTSAMIVLESADLSSAVRSAVENVWSCNGQNFWSPNYIYIQESVFDVFTKLLEKDAVNFLEAMGITGQNSGDGPRGKPTDHKVIQPIDSQFFKFLLGWHPDILERETLIGRGSVLLPFRTNEEVLSTVNLLPNCFSASVWTEKMCNHVTSRLKVNTIWVNCHGLLVPDIPFHSSPSSVVPINGSELMLKLLLLTRVFKSFDLGGDSDKKAPELKLDESDVTVDKAKEFFVECLKKEIKSPLQLTLNERFSLLEPLRNEISEVTRRLLGAAPCDSKLLTTNLGMEIKTYKAFNRGPLIIGQNNLTMKSDDFILQLVYLAILNGSSVILNGFEPKLVPALEDLKSKGYLATANFGHLDMLGIVDCLPATYLLIVGNCSFTDIRDLKLTELRRNLFVTTRDLLQELYQSEHWLTDLKTVALI